MHISVGSITYRQWNWGRDRHLQSTRNLFKPWKETMVTEALNIDFLELITSTGGRYLHEIHIFINNILIFEISIKNNSIK